VCEAHRDFSVRAAPANLAHAAAGFNLGGRRAPGHVARGPAGHLMATITPARLAVLEGSPPGLARRERKRKRPCDGGPFLFGGEDEP
jgi:hypothetical protein